MIRKAGMAIIAMMVMLCGVSWAPAQLVAATPPPFQPLARLPVKEVTVFKDGHAFVLHSGRMPTDAAGNVALDYLPTPVIGTFWPFASGDKARLISVTAGQRKVLIDRSALTLKELIQANVGAEVMVTETAAGTGTVTYAATILEIPARKGEELEAAAPPSSGDKLTEVGNIAMLKTERGVKIVGLERIQDISFMSSYRTTVAREEFRNLLSLKLDWGDRPQSEAEVGLMYLQRGIRWIPNYRVSIDGKGKAVVTLQATLINELSDLEDVTLHLVVGVPSFEFKDTADPMSLQQTVAQLSQYFRQDAQTAYAFSNAIMTQQRLRMTETRPEPAGPTMDLGPEIAESGKKEDLFVFSIPHVTMKKGERMVLTIGESVLKYKDVFTLDLAFAPPPEVWQSIHNSRPAEAARLFTPANVMHKIRLFNGGNTPLTTAPALILKDGRVLAQGLMTYASPGSATDLSVTTSVDIRVTKSDNETKRTPNAVVWQGTQYGRIDLTGKIGLTSFCTETTEIEVTRHVLGNVDSADNKGASEMVNTFEDLSFASGSGAIPSWWGWYSWPWWWHRFNGVGRIKWTVKLYPKKTVDLGYAWNYYWN